MPNVCRINYGKTKNYNVWHIKSLPPLPWAPHQNIKGLPSQVDLEGFIQARYSYTPEEILHTKCNTTLNTNKSQTKENVTKMSLKF